MYTRCSIDHTIPRVLLFALKVLSVGLSQCYLQIASLKRTKDDAAVTRKSIARNEPTEVLIARMSLDI